MRWSTMYNTNHSRIKDTGLLDTCKYDDVFLLAKILLQEELTEDEKERVKRRFEKKPIMEETI